MGIDQVLSLVEDKLGRKLERVGGDALPRVQPSIAPPYRRAPAESSRTCIGSASCFRWEDDRRQMRGLQAWRTSSATATFA